MCEATATLTDGVLLFLGGGGKSMRSIPEKENLAGDDYQRARNRKTWRCDASD